MKARGSVAASILAAALVGCADRPAPAEPTFDRRGAGAEATARFETSSRPIAEMEALELTAGMRTAMTRSLSAALAELDIQPNASMRVLDEFFQRVEARHAERRQARADLLRTVHP